MKKITLLLAFVACALVSQAQNLLTNPSFEDWTDSKPTPWYVVGTTTGFTMEQETSTILDGLKSCKMNVPTTASGTTSVAQGISIVGGKTYTLSMSYYIVSGDGTDARIWCNFKSGTTYFAEADLIATGLYSKLRGPGNENKDGSVYFADEKGAWKTYTIEFTAPAAADGFDFQFRTYKGAVVIWDKFTLVEKTTGISTPSASALDVKLVGKTLTVSNALNAVEIYNTVGAKVQTLQLVNGSAELSLAKGLYIVRAGNQSAKIRL